jgi:hypothetical protein
MTFLKDEFALVPFDQNVTPFDIDDYLSRNRIENSKLFFLKDRNDQCSSNCKEDIKVLDYLSPRLGDQAERNLSTAVPMLYMRYFDVGTLTKILHLSENSKINDQLLSDTIKKASSKLDKISKNLFAQAYFYIDPDSDESFMEQTVKHIRNLESGMLPRYRILYKYLLKVFRTPDETAFDEIMNEKDMRKSQEMFDKYFQDNIDKIKFVFFVDMVPSMAKELKELSETEEET